MGITINLDTSLVKEGRLHSKIPHRSVPKQIKHWAEIGRMVEDNPDLIYSQIRDILLGLQDHARGREKIAMNVLPPPS